MSSRKPVAPRLAEMAHQRVVRERLAVSEATETLFGPYWNQLNHDIAGAVVREIDQRTATAIVEKYEWMGCMPAVVWHSFGIFFDDTCAGVVCYGPEYSENLGIISRERGVKGADWSRYGFEGKMILLSRGACVHWAHPHAGSMLVRRSMKLLPTVFEVVTATVDPMAGEIGTIYQACGFDYVGSMRDSNPNVNSRELDRDGWLINGKLYGSRTIRAMFGTTKWAVVSERFPDVQKIKQHSKGRYFAFRGHRAIQKKHRAAIQHLIKPYPKRHVGTL